MSLENAEPLSFQVGDGRSVLIAAANPRRWGLIVTNPGAVRLYVAMAAVATTDLYTVALDTDDYWEAPLGRNGKVYAGPVAVILDTASPGAVALRSEW